MPGGGLASFLPCFLSAEEALSERDDESDLDDQAEERHRNASKGGRRGGRGRPAKAGAEGLQNIKDLLQGLTDDVLVLCREMNFRESLFSAASENNPSRQLDE
jgi:hypothetical protein